MARAAFVSGQDKIVMTVRYSGYLIMKAKRAPVELVYPSEGLVATPQPYGLVKEAPHPRAARRFLDWFLGVPGQAAAVAAVYYHSPRCDVPLSRPVCLDGERRARRASSSSPGCCLNRSGSIPPV